jgi:putative chitinase
MGNLATNVRLTQLSGKGFAKVFDETGKAVDNAAAGFDDSTNAATELRIAQMNSRDSMENFLQHGVKPVTMGMELLAKAIDKLLRFLPGSSSIADAKKEQQRLETERAKAVEDLNTRKQQLASGDTGTKADTGLAQATAVLAGNAIAKQEESKKELEVLKETRASSEEIAQAQKKLAESTAERERLEQQEIRDARAAAQKRLETQNRVAAARRAENAIIPPKSSKSPDLVKDTDLLDRLTKGGITDKKAQANVLAQIKAESGGVAKSENLNYSPERLLKMFPKHVKDLEDAKSLVSQGPEAIGNRVYGNRMGNAADEGYRYRGRGIIQITGKNNYKKYGDLIGQDLVSNPDLANDPEIAKQIAVAYFQQKQKEKFNLSDISSIGKAVGYAGGEAETAKRAQLAQMYESQIPQAADGDVLSGPRSGYRAVLHGTEAVVPLPDGRTIPVTIAGLAEHNERLSRVLSALETRMGSTSGTGIMESDTLLRKMDDLIRVASDQLGVSGKILKAQA